MLLLGISQQSVTGSGFFKKIIGELHETIYAWHDVLDQSELFA